MIKLKKVLAGIVASTLMLSAVGCGMIEKTEEGVNNTVVAKVYKEKITLGKIDANLTPFFSQLKQAYGENYKENEEAVEYLKQQRLKMLDTLVNDVIFAKKAEELGVKPTDEELAEQAQAKLDEVKNSFEDDTAYQNALTASGINEEEFLKELKLTLISNAVYEETVKDVEATDEEISQYYTTNQTSFTESPNKVKPAHILVKTEEEANAIIERLNNGEDFATLAKELGTDGTKESGGDLGWIDYTSNQIDKTFLMAAITLNKDEYTKTPVATKFGYHVIKCLDKEEYPVKPLEDVKEEVKGIVLQQKQYDKWKETVEQWQKDAKVKRYEDKLTQ